MRLGFGELKLRKKGLLPEMQLLGEMHFQTKVILLRTPRTLVLSTTTKTAVSVSLNSTSKMNAIQQPNSFDRQRRQHTRSKRMNLIGACHLCFARDQLPDQ